MRYCMLTTIDNPYDPSTDFDEWLSYDNDHDYFSCEKVARLAATSDELTEEENNQAIEEAIDEIIANDVLNIFIKKVYEDTEGGT